MRLSAGHAIDSARTITVEFDGAPLEALDGDTLASALMAAGRVVFGVHSGTGRPRGLRWLDRSSEVAVNLDGRKRFHDPARLVLQDRMKIVPASGQTPAQRLGGGAEADVLVVGAGPAGLIAAETAQSGGARVTLVDSATRPGGMARWSGETLSGRPGADWARAKLEALLAGGASVMMEAELLPGADEAWRIYRHDLGAIWTLRATHTILATGAVARMPAFGNNDLPGIMTAATMRQALSDWGVLPGRRIAVFSGGDEGALTAATLVQAGAEVVALVDVRGKAGGGEWPVFVRSAVRRALGDGQLEAIEVDGPDGRQTISCDGLAVAAGWSPQIAPLMSRVRPIWNPSIAAWLIPPGGIPGVHPAGAAGGSFSTKAAVKSGYFRARKVLAALGRASPPVPLPNAEDAAGEYATLWQTTGPGPSFLDFGRGLTLEEVTAGGKAEDRAAKAGAHVADPRLT